RATSTPATRRSPPTCPNSSTACPSPMPASTGAPPKPPSAAFVTRSRACCPPAGCCDGNQPAANKKPGRGRVFCWRARGLHVGVGGVGVVGDVPHALEFRDFFQQGFFNPFLQGQVHHAAALAAAAELEHRNAVDDIHQ